MKPARRNLLVSAIAFCVAIFLSSVPESGAGPEKIVQSVPSSPESYNWGGVYAGFNVGGGWNHFDIGDHVSTVNLEEQFYEVTDDVGIESVFTDFRAPGHEHTDAEVIGGGQIGFNLQFGHFVIGIEGAIDGNGTDANSKTGGFQEDFLFDHDKVQPQQEEDIFYESSFGSRRTAETIYNGFIGGHLGYAWNRLLFLVDGGAAFSDVHFSADDQAATSFFDETCAGNCPDVAPATAGRVANVHPATVVSPQLDNGFPLGEAFNKSRPSHGDILTGWYAGCETDYALNNTVSVGIEYRRVNWGDVTDRFRSGGPVFPGSTRLSLTGDQVVLKVNVMIAHFLPAVQ